MGENKMKRLEADIRKRQGVTGERETRLLGVAEPGYTEFAETGGVSPEMRAATRRRTASGIGSYIQNQRRMLESQRRRQGGYAPGYGAQQAKLARTGAIATGEALTGAELGLLRREQEGRLAGLGGIGALTQGYQGEQIPLLGIREQLERKRRGKLGTIATASKIATDWGKAWTGFG
jgi:hypothetical protein